MEDNEQHAQARQWTPEELEKGARWMRLIYQARDKARTRLAATVVRQMSIGGTATTR